MTGPEPIQVSHLLRRTVPDGPLEFVDGTRPVDHEKVVEVALNPDDELRNLQVALLYSLTSNRVDKRLLYEARHRRPARPETTRANANWFTVAQWAVLTVGRNLRTRDLPHRTSVLPETLRRRLTPAILNLRAADDRRVAAALSYGQVMVFASVYRALLKTPFADGVELPRGELADLVEKPPPEAIPEPDEFGPEGGEGDAGGSVDEAEPSLPVLDLSGLAEVVDSLVADKHRRDAEEVRADRVQRGTVLALAAQLGARVQGIDARGERGAFYAAVLDAIADRAGYESELLEALDLYRRAARWSAEQRSGRERPPADLIFEATLRIAAIEQVILDEAVTMVVDHLPRHVMEQAEGRIATFAERSLHVPRRLAQVSSARRLSLLGGAAREVWARVMTDQVMVVAFPSETVRIGRDIPSRDWRKPFYAEDLQHLSPEAEAVFDQFDRSLGDGRGAGASDWRRYDDRMNFVSNLLRSRQQDASLFWQPFTDEDVDRVWRGLYPGRNGDPFESAVRSPSFPTDEDGTDLDTVSCDEVTWAKQPPGPVEEHDEEDPA